MARAKKSKKGEAVPPTESSPPPFRIQVTVSLCDARGKEYGPRKILFEKQSPISFAEIAWELANASFSAVEELAYKRSDILMKPVAQISTDPKDSPILEPMKRHRKMVDEFTSKEKGGSYEKEYKATDDDVPF